MRADVIDAVLSTHHDDRPLIYLPPRGPDSPIWRTRFSLGPGLRVLCGRYEGIDQRVLDKWQPLELCLGDFVLSGGEIAALALIDACVRLLPGVMGNAQSGQDESFETGLLEYPLYTKPTLWDGRAVPAVLTSGDHEAVKSWRQQAAEATTQTRRPDLWGLIRLSHVWIEQNKGLGIMNLLQTLEAEQVASLTAERPRPEFWPGDTIKVNVRVVEGTRERIQAYEGVVIAIKNRGLNSAFTVRKISYNEGVERVFPLHSPRVDSIEVLKRGGSAALNYTICGTVVGNLPVLQKNTGWSAKLRDAERAKK